MEVPQLTLRQRDILRAVVRDYILTAEPVGSRTLSRKYDLNLSPATIRNELADLEEEGLLKQPHTSAGRVPSDFGYRFFVDSLMERAEIPPEKQAVIDSVQGQARDLDDLLLQTARLTAVLAGCTAIVRAPRQTGSRIRSLYLLRVGEAESLLVLCSSTGAVTHTHVRLPGATTDEELQLLSNFLNAELKGQPLDGLTYRTLQQISSKLANYRDYLETLWDGLLSPHEGKDQVIVSNTSLIAQQPEFNDGSKVSSLLAFLERQAGLAELMDALVDQGQSPGAVNIRIGSENVSPDLAECSLVTATYAINGQVAGEIAVLGPTRLDYQSAVAAVATMAARLTRALSFRFMH